MSLLNKNISKHLASDDSALSRDKDYAHPMKLVGINVE